MELLSPAGNVKHIDVALNNNVGAVYGGLKNWNARHKATNFTITEYNESVKKLHENKIKFFLTLNTLVLDDEIEDILNFLKDENTELPDAFIVTDIGLIKKLKEEFPNVELHFSTQFGIHNLDDVELMKSLGGKRAILARELTKQEIDNLRSNTDIDLECFVWGSQCISYSGLCFFGSLMNGGSGNRGKCIITCRDVYSANNKTGNLLYIPDLDCINIIPELDIECIKLEGRRRSPKELDKIIKQIKNQEKSVVTNGFINGTSYNDNKLFEIINSRIKPIYKKSELKIISDYDVFMKYENNIPIGFATNNDLESYYTYSEYKSAFNINKKNISFDLTIIPSHSSISEVLYVNYKGEGKTFIEEDFKSEYIEFNLDEFIKMIESRNSAINIYKIKYVRNQENKHFISRSFLEKIVDYVINDCSRQSAKEEIRIKFEGVKRLYVETNDLTIVRELISNNGIKIIYNIASIDKFKNINSVIEEFDDKLIYKLPIFNWKSEDLSEYYNLLKNKEVMFTKLSQIFKTSDINFKRKYMDYTIYIWNKESLSIIEKYNIDTFTASPELSFKQNCMIYDDKNIQFIIAGKLPLVYTRQCFDQVYGCGNCLAEINQKKIMKNDDKQMQFKIICESDHRFIIYDEPMLNNFYQFNNRKNTTYRYVTYGQSIEEIKESIRIFQKNNYFETLKSTSTWQNSFDGNLAEGKE